MSPLGSFLEEYLSSQDFSAGFSPGDKRSKIMPEGTHSDDEENAGQGEEDLVHQPLESLLGHSTKPLPKDANVPSKQEKWSEQEQVKSPFQV